MRGPRQSIAWLALTSIMSVVVLACSPTSSPPKGRSPIFLDAAGTCPMGYPNRPPPEVCLHDQYYGNARAGVFSPQHGPWGLAYAFNCWGKKRSFGMRIGLSGADFSWGEIDLYGRKKGSGSVMESGKVGPPVQGGVRYQYLAEIRTPCTWHVRGVDGSPKVVRSYIPPIPRRKH